MKFKNFFIISLFFILTMTVNVLGNGLMTTSYDNQGQYRVKDNLANIDLGYDVIYRQDLGESRTLIDKTPTGGDKNAAGSGGGGLLNPDIFYDQKISILEGKASDRVKVVNWAYTSESKYSLRNVINLALDYEKNHPGWKVIGGMNSDFFDLGGANPLPYQPLGPMISDGEVIRAAGAHNYSLMIGFKNQGLPDDLVAKKYMQTANGFDENISPLELTIYDSNDNIIKKFVIAKHNAIPENDEISLYNAIWDQSKNIVPKSIDTNLNCYVVEKAEKALVNTNTDFYGRGLISSFEGKTLSEGEFAIVSNNKELQSYLKMGVKVKVERSFTGIFAGVSELTSGHGYILEDGKESALLNEVYYYTRAPRSLLGIKPDGTIVMLAIDGRQPNDNMYGATQEEMAAIMKHYGCVEAYNLDGGGSTTLIVREGKTFKTVNNPSDSKTSLRAVSNAIFFVVHESEIEESITQISTDKVEINLNVLKNNNHDIKELYIHLDDQLTQLTDGKVLFNNLKPNTEYLYTIYYKDSNNKLHKTLHGDKITTAKRKPVLKDFIIEYDGNNTKFIPIFDDPDKSLIQQSVTINKKTAFIIGGSADFKNLDIDFKKDGVIILYNYRYNLNNLAGIVEVNLTNPHQDTALFFQIILRKHSEKIKSIVN